MATREAVVLSCLCLALVCRADICTNKTCVYEFRVQLDTTMTHLGMDVVLNGTRLQAVMDGGMVHDVDPDDVIIADGVRRTVTTINGQIPGPTIEVMAGAQIIVHVTNGMAQRITAVHWHGMRQVGTYFMDGAATVTQCPILPGQRFTYRFRADPVGTHWYHSHVGSQRLDGLHGLLIVHDAPPTTAYHGVTVGDWFHVTAEEMDMMNTELCENGAGGPQYVDAVNPPPDCSVDGSQIRPDDTVSALIGGRGRWNDRPFPVREYAVRGAATTRFRVVNVGHQLPFELSVDGHRLVVVATDGSPVQPIVVDSLFVFVAETIDVELVADQTPDRYWMRADTPCKQDAALAVVVYDAAGVPAAPAGGSPTSKRRSCTATAPCAVFNCPFGRYPDGSNRICIPMGRARSTLGPDELWDRFGVGAPDWMVDEYFLNFAMTVGSSINGRRYAEPIEPLFQKDRTSERAMSDCGRVGPPCLDGCRCRCTQVLTLESDSIVQLVVTNMQPDDRVIDDGYHTIHLHGHNFAVIAQRFPTYNSTSGYWTTPNDDVTCGSSDPLCAHARWSRASGRPFCSDDATHQPVVKDSVVLPVRGYLVLRFRTNNPGLWMVHCHVDMHMMEGMAIVINEAPDLQPALPRGFPTCNEFTSKKGRKKSRSCRKPKNIETWNRISQPSDKKATLVKGW